MSTPLLRIDDEFYSEIARRVARLLERPPAAEWMTIEQAAAHLQRSPDSVRALIKRGLIPHYRAGGRVRLEREELDGWVRGEAPAAGW